MQVLFISIVNINTIEEHNIYSDLIKEFAKRGHTIYVVSPAERKEANKIGFLITEKVGSGTVNILKIRTGNIQKTNFIEKGISTFLLENQLKNGIKANLDNVKFDLVLYSTPPVTIVRPIQFIKRRDNAKTYLMLKDITPQAIVDLGALKTTGWRGFIYKYFKQKERKLYKISDYIGCMSQANMDYVLKNNSFINSEKVELCPNCIDIYDKKGDATREDIRQRYGIPPYKKVFLYGGNLGLPQGIPFVLECLKSQKENERDFFLIVGDGTEYEKIRKELDVLDLKNVGLIKGLPKDEYEKLVDACDIGLVFLSYKFTVPNFPSRILSYMHAKKPILACTDIVSDVGKTIVEGEFGWWCPSNDVNAFCEIINAINDEDISAMGEKSYNFLVDHYSVEKGCDIISAHC